MAHEKYSEDLKMANLPKFTLTKDEKKGDWVLRNDETNRAKARLDTKTVSHLDLPYNVDSQLS